MGNVLRGSARTTPIGTWVAFLTVPLVIVFLATGCWNFSGQHLSQVFACNGRTNPHAAQRAISQCNALFASRDVTGGARAAILRHRGEDYRDEGDYAHALADLVQSDKLEPREYRTLEDLADLHEAVGDSASAASDYKRLFAILPTEAYPVSERCSDRAHSGKLLAQALVDCNASIAFNPRDPNAIAGRAMVELKEVVSQRVV